MSRPCWPGRNENCVQPRTWAVFHDQAEAQKPFSMDASIYIGTCSGHLLQSLRYDPGALNVVMALPEATS